MKLIKDYAKERNISHQAVYKLIENHETELKDYIVKQGRTRYLMPEAEEILDSYRNKSQIVIEKQDRIDEIERLKEENRNLLLKIAAQADKIAELSEWKSDHALLIAEANANTKLLKDKTKELEEAKLNRDKAEAELEQYRNASLIQRIFGYKK